MKFPGWARFDDLVDGTAVVVRASRGQVVAHNLDEVVAALAEVERRTAAGQWAFGYVAYEAASAFDSTLSTHEPMPGLPLVWFGFADQVALVPAVGSAGRCGVRRVTPQRAARRMDVGSWHLDWDEARYSDAVEAVRGQIAAGETYQVNLTCRSYASLQRRGRGGGVGPADMVHVYERLAGQQRGRYNAYIETNRHTVVGASPELFFQWQAPGAGESGAGTVTMRPMKGTAPRGADEQGDEAAVAALLASEKERAENLMIVDLVRNDLQRIAVTGGVQVRELLTPEVYPTVHQLTSTVSTQLRDGVGLTDMFRVLFPCGSVTGAPKASTMSIIKELETSPRGVYCGAVGLVTPPGQRVVPYRARFNVPIRTAVVDAGAGRAVYGVGSGVTYDSRAAAEWRELAAKTRVLQRGPGRFHLIETMRAVDGAVVHFDEHVERLASSARFLGFRWDEGVVRAAVEEEVARFWRAGGGAAKVRLTLCRDGQVGGVAVEAPSFSPLPVVPPVERGVLGEEMLGVVIDEEPVWSGDWRLRHKTSLREVYVSRRERHPGADEVLLVNEKGHVTEGTVSNVAVLVDGRWVTPSLGEGLLPGTARRVLCESGVVVEGCLSADDVRQADGVAVFNDLRGWRWGRVL
ncbi:chorismate-binding protein [Dermatophilus congolensis]|uniref:Para-aminobenzoate synthase component 1 n=1 Tax=Dermatophilus congolensis TaxID=1863 RepID=A0A239VVP7_9MICO|nr:chorismate-binding protein [Dermatophilus congolensis]MBO3130025.1 aminodeoxychorismate synthase, component I [Dermatophilus congolensis]MBO3131345.1 aminodeoxychorismate synthase, component I [Dermatophilus congolensis]MBO3134499.1 aminodeoxychorismate synthase, component I [Dermatophilus congolensis]MBO3136734.1 aminodeoxychorismate synthase, component I [Dermatophilus congolensis]MBO3138979.1 aminodeoxychorismate synthase, component I [Dermatophilus congolensis]